MTTQALMVPRAALAWVVGGDTGTSSQTIWSVMVGVKHDRPWTPLDSDDFGRCYRLLELVPEWRKRLPEVAALHPDWKPLVREWDRLTSLYEKGSIVAPWDNQKLGAEIRTLAREVTA